MLRGINQQQIFEEAEDDQKFLQILEDCKCHRGRFCLSHDKQNRPRRHPDPLILFSCVNSLF